MQFIYAVVVFLFLSACTAAPQSSATTTGNAGTAPGKKPTLGQVLLKQTRELQDENKRLKVQIEHLGKAQQESRLRSQESTDKLTQTIMLLEKNLIDIQQRIAAQPHSPAKAPKKTAVLKKQVIASKTTEKKRLPGKSVDSVSGGKRAAGSIEFKTPGQSRAIETANFLNSGEITTTKKVAAVRPPKKTIPLTIPRKKAEKKKIPAARQEEMWEDPDLEPPVSPIPLRIQAGAKRRYKEAFKSFTQKKYSTAVKEFQKFLKRYPNDQDADNSQFWIGQCYFQLENYLSAEQAFRHILKDYAHGETQRGYKTPDAVLMLGRIYLLRGRPMKARYYFNKVVAVYPKTQSAAKARREIQSMKKL